MSNRSAGTQKERDLEKLLTGRGWLTHRARASGTRFRGRDGKDRYVVHSNDLFGAIDIEAHRIGDKTLYIQATARGGEFDRKEKLAKVLERFFDLARETVQVWSWGKWGVGFSWRVWQATYNHDGATWQWVERGSVSMKGVVNGFDTEFLALLRPSILSISVPEGAIA